MNTQVEETDDVSFNLCVFIYSDGGNSVNNLNI